MKRLYITIHALSTWNEAKQVQGHCDTPLSATGEQMAQLLGTRTDMEDIKAIYTSDLMRTVLTAEPLAQRLQVPVIQQEYLRERNYEQHFVDPLCKPKPCSYGWETREELTSRAQWALESLVRSATDFPVLVVTHSGFLKAFLARIDPETVDTYQSIRTAINTVVYQDGQWQIVSLNDDRHLQPLADAVDTALDRG